MIYVISGGPATGKTSVINELEKKGYKVLKEAAREVSLKDKRFQGKSTKEINKKEFQEAIFELQMKEIEKLKDNKEVIFSDRGLGDTLAYYVVNKLRVPKYQDIYAKKFRYAGVFILEPLDFYKQDELRQESKTEAEKIHKTIAETYELLGYYAINILFMSVEERVEFIISKIN